jgi:hypothetical protein
MFLCRIIIELAHRFQKIDNITIAIRFIQDQGVKLIGIGAPDIVDGNVKLTLGLLWPLILRYQLSTAGGTESPKAALFSWIKNQLEPYNIEVKDFDSRYHLIYLQCIKFILTKINSWQDGRALCALTDSLQVNVLCKLLPIKCDNRLDACHWRHSLWIPLQTLIEQSTLPKHSSKSPIFLIPLILSLSQMISAS